MTAAKKQKLSSDQATFSKWRYNIMEHMMGVSGRAHLAAVKQYETRKKMKAINQKIAMTLLRASVADIEMAAAGAHFETLVALLALSGADVGNIGHGL